MQWEEGEQKSMYGVRACHFPEDYNRRKVQSQEARWPAGLTSLSRLTSPFLPQGFPCLPDKWSVPNFQLGSTKETLPKGEKPPGFLTIWNIFRMAV